MEDICKDCNCNCRNEHDCDSCEYNIGQDPSKSSGYIAGSLWSAELLVFYDRLSLQ